MLAIASYFAYADPSSPAAGESSSERVNDARLYDSQRIEIRTGNPPFQAEVGQQEEAAPASWWQTPGPTVGVPSTIYSGSLPGAGGQGEVLHG
jgi:hypothetical protein